MSRKALIFASEPGFGELIDQVFDDFGGYESRSVDLALAKRGKVLLQSVDLAIIDADLGHENVSGIAKNLRRESPNLRLVIILAKNSPGEGSFDGFAADYVLTAPFYLPDLISVLHKLAGSWPKGDEKASILQDSHSASWMMDKVQAAQHLTQLTLESASQAAIIIRANKLWAYAGELPQPAIEELLASLAHYWQEDNPVDFARFVHLNSTDEDYMLYAKLLAEEFALAMAFNAKLPFSKMRARVSEMAQALESRYEGNSTEFVEEKLVSQERQTIFQGKGLHVSERDSVQNSAGTKPKPPRTSSDPTFENLVNREALKEDELLTPAAPQSRELFYSFALIPRLPEHRLEGDLKYQLTKWMPQLCLAFACRLEYLSVESHSLQWTVSVSPEASPESLVQTMERQLSQRIFDTFPPLKQENPSGEFWAQSALILNAEQASRQSVKRYIQDTRTRQGVPSNS